MNVNSYLDHRHQKQQKFNSVWELLAVPKAIGWIQLFITTTTKFVIFHFPKTIFIRFQCFLRHLLSVLSKEVCSCSWSDENEIFETFSPHCKQVRRVQLLELDLFFLSCLLDGINQYKTRNNSFSLLSCCVIVIYIIRTTYFRVMY